MRRLVLLLLLLAAPAGAQTVVTSPGPNQVAVTVYRDPERDATQPLDLDWLNGFALVSETRQVSIPAGESEIRFEGVAGGILPQSAIVTGLPEDIVERNRDAYLLSPGTLLDRSLGRRVHLRRTSLATGMVREHEAVIRSGIDGSVVLETEEGFEALRCTGLAETLVYDSVPAELSAKPTLSVRTRSRQALTATVTLSYLASGFDWQANYVAMLSPSGDRIDLFAWLTLANGDETSFANANTQAVAGRLNRDDVRAPPSESRPLTLQCWPQGTTSDLPVEDLVNSLPQAFASPPPPPPAPAMRAESIVVTGSRISMQAEQEDLGDLKLYRIPEPVTIAANSQKQVALLTREDVRVDLVYRARLYPTDIDNPRPANRFLVTRNRTAEGLGLPLPAGGFVLFLEAAGRPILIGEGHVRDSAVGEDVEVMIGEAAGVTTAIALVGDGKEANEYLLTVTNDRAQPVRFEGEFAAQEDEGFRPRRRLPRRDGRPLWEVTVPANGTATLRYRIRND